MTIDLTREQQFLRDYRVLRDWCSSHQLKLVNHKSLVMVANRMTPSKWKEIIFGIGDLRTNDQILSLSSEYVVAMVGSQFGLGIPAKDFSKVGGVYLLAVASISLLSGCYVGIHMYRIENGAHKSYDVKFVDGETRSSQENS